MLKQEDVKNFILEWNVKFPLDKWWREKHKVAFLSTIHKQASFIHQLLEWEEENLFEELRKESEYKPNQGDFLKTREEKVTNDDFVDYAKEELRNFNANARQEGQNIG